MVIMRLGVDEQYGCRKQAEQNEHEARYDVRQTASDLTLA